MLENRKFLFLLLLLPFLLSGCQATREFPPPMDTDAVIVGIRMTVDHISRPKGCHPYFVKLDEFSDGLKVNQLLTTVPSGFGLERGFVHCTESFSTSVETLKVILKVVSIVQSGDPDRTPSITTC